MSAQIATYDDVLAELTRRRLDLGDSAKRFDTSRQYARWCLIRKLAGVPPAPHTKGGKVLASIDAAIAQPSTAQTPVAVGEEI